jgi:hypothetical protein
VKVVTSHALDVLPSLFVVVMVRGRNACGIIVLWPKWKADIKFVVPWTICEASLAAVHGVCPHGVCERVC